MSFVFAVVVAAVFVYAGVAKFATFNNWTFQARALGAPDPFVVLVPLAEIALAVLLVGGWWFMQTVIAGMLLLSAFTILLLVRLRDPERLPCSCFGATSQRPMSWLDVFRNVLLITLLAVAVLTK
ncbi:MAG: DoxX family protein [Acidimicrobiaceae bacterium]|nr:DoxX family protein [Acidimicrobiaceae bacterium]